MSERNFIQLLKDRWDEGKFVCVGLDSTLEKIPLVKSLGLGNSGFNGDTPQFAFNRRIVDATHDLVAAYKPNCAFYEALGAYGITQLQLTIRYIHDVAPEVPVILDMKRADIGNSNVGYTEYAFNYLDADSVTVPPYMGMEAMRPFLDHKDRGVIVLCRTSNKGSEELQGLQTQTDAEPETGKEKLLWHRLAEAVQSAWNYNGNCGLVFGATKADEMKLLRQFAPSLPILIPGVGTQGGDLEASVEYGRTANGAGFVVNSSSGIIFASNGENFAEVAREKTLELHGQIELALERFARS